MKKQHLLRVSLVIFLFTVGGYGCDYLVRAFLASKFGDSIQMDAFLLATSIPLWLVTVLVTTMNKAYIPLYSELLVLKKEKHALKLTSNILNLFFVLSVIVVGTGILLSFVIIPFLLPSQSIDSQQLITQLFQISLPFVVFSGTISILISILYAQKIFLAASASLFLQKILYLMLLIGLFPFFHIHATVISLSLSGFFVVVVLFIYMFVKKKITYQFILKPSDENIKRFFGLLSPLLLGALIYKSLTVIDQYMASFLDTGSITYISYGKLVVTVPIGLVGASIATAIFPSFSEESAKKNIPRLKKSLLQGLRLSTYLLLPLMIIFIILRLPIIQLLFQRGAFSLDASIGTSDVLLYYVGYLFGASVGALLSSMLYALQETKTVVKIGIAGALVNIVLNFVFIKYLGANGLALGSSIASLVNVALFLYILHNRMKGFTYQDLLPYGKMIIVSFFTILFIHFIHSRLAFYSLGSEIVVISVLGLCFYLTLSYIFQLREFQDIYHVLIRKNIKTRL